VPRFYFHLDDGGSFHDEEGAELATVAAARDEALRFLGHSLADKPGDFWARGQWRLSIADEAGATLFTVEVSAADAPPVIAAMPEAT
jgi:hypothetical protein